MFTFRKIIARLNDLRPVSDSGAQNKSHKRIQEQYEAWRLEAVKEALHSREKPMEPEDVPTVVQVLAEYGVDIANERLVMSLSTRRLQKDTQ